MSFQLSPLKMSVKCLEKSLIYVIHTHITEHSYLEIKTHKKTIYSHLLTIFLRNKSQDRDQWRDLVNTVMSLRVPYNVGNFLIRWATVNFSRCTVLRGGARFESFTAMQFQVAVFWVASPWSEVSETFLPAYLGWR